MKKIFIRDMDVFPTKVVLCLSDKARLKYLNKNFQWLTDEDRQRNSNAVTHVIKEDGYLTLVIGFDTDITNVYELRGLIVHELSHCVTETMIHLGLNCDETRSYMIQRLYIDVMQYLDENYKGFE